MPDPGAQRGGSNKSSSPGTGSSQSGPHGKSEPGRGGISATNIGKAEASKGPLASLVENPIARGIIGLAIPGIGIPDILHGAAKALGSGYRSITDALGLETTAPAIDLSFNTLGDVRDGGNAFDKIASAASRFNQSQQVGSSLGIASNLFTGTNAALIPAAELLEPGKPIITSTPPHTRDASAGIGNQIIQKAGIEKIKEMVDGNGDGEKAAKKATPTQATDRPVQKAGKKREAGRSDIAQQFLDLLLEQLNIKS